MHGICKMQKEDEELKRWCALWELAMPSLITYVHLDLNGFIGAKSERTNDGIKEVLVMLIWRWKF